MTSSTLCRCAGRGLPLARMTAALVAALWVPGTMARAQALPGSLPGTEQYVVTFRSRAFDLRQRLAEIRGLPTRTLREQKWSELEALVEIDQAGFTSDLERRGGRVRRHLWVVNGLVAEIPTRELGRFRADPRVLGLWPNEARGTGSIFSESGAPPPTNLWWLDDFNHRIGPAWAVPGTPMMGEGVTVAVLDTGLDRHHFLNTFSLTVQDPSPAANPHPAFWVDANQTILQTTLQTYSNVRTRLWESFRPRLSAGTPMDCNDQLPTTGKGRHGTGVAGIAAGASVLSTSTGLPLSYTGHAPRSLLVGFSITEEVVCNPGNHHFLWVATPESYLSAIQDLVFWISQNPQQRAVAVLNISVDGFPDPRHPVSLALDALSSDPDLDILVTVLAGNEGDSTTFSHGGWNPLSVGAVHQRASISEPYYPLVVQSRGPMVGNSQRLFPDLCATGAGSSTAAYWSQPGPVLRMPLADSRTASYDAYGTSMAAPQAAGAGALYRARRKAAAASDSALETKAALLLNVDDPYTRTVQNTYRARNTYGVGYVRDDWLMEYAEREGTPAIHALGHTIHVPQGATSAATSYIVRRGPRYAVAAAWFFPGHWDAIVELPNVDMEVLRGQTLLARSALTQSSHERVVFTTEGYDLSITEQVTVRVTLDAPAEFAFDVFLAGRELPAELQDAALPGGVYAGPGQVLGQEQGSGCAGNGSVGRVTRVIPVSYAEAYGSEPIGKVLGSGNGQSQVFGRSIWGSYFNTVITPDEVGGDFAAVGIAFRAWAPFRATTSTLKLKSMFLYETTVGPASVHRPTQPSTPTTYDPNAVNVVQVFQRSTPVPPDVDVQLPTWTALGPDTWSIIVPFDSGITYQYQGASQGRNLGLWIEMDRTDPTPWPICEVDWVDDGSHGPCASDHYGTSFLNDQTIYVGQCPVFGLLEPEPAGNLPPHLSLMGEPRLDETLLFRVEQVPASTSALWLLNCAVAPVTFVPSTCDFLLPDFVAAQGSNTAASSVLYAQAPPFSLPATLNVDVFWQAVVINGSVTSASNTLTTRFGGFRQ